MHGTGTAERALLERTKPKVAKDLIQKCREYRDSADARAQGFRIIPLCPYVRSRYEKHPDWQDVMTVAPGETPHIRSKGAE